jgi:short-subunit dehydrogenase
MEELASKMKSKHGCQVDTLVQDLNNPNNLQHVFSTVLQEERNLVFSFTMQLAEWLDTF